MTGDNGKKLVDPKGNLISDGVTLNKKGEMVKEQEKPKEGHLGVIRVGDKDIKIVNIATVMEIQVFKLENGQEVSKLVAHEFMMVDHKTYLVRLLTDAIMMVMRAKKRQNMVKLMGQATFNKLVRSSRLKNFLRGKKHG